MNDNLNRIEYILENDKIIDPQSVCEILKEEVYPIINNYVLLSGELKVRFRKQETRNLFSIEFEVNKIKPFGYIPQSF